jgi:hypothetical protein
VVRRQGKKLVVKVSVSFEVEVVEMVQEAVDDFFSIIIETFIHLYTYKISMRFVSSCCYNLEAGQALASGSSYLVRIR